LELYHEDNHFDRKGERNTRLKKSGIKIDGRIDNSIERNDISTQRRIAVTVDLMKDATLVLL
jgi:hypothetical protein